MARALGLLLATALLLAGCSSDDPGSSDGVGRDEDPGGQPSLDERAVAEHALLRASDFTDAWDESPAPTGVPEVGDQQRRTAECVGVSADVLYGGVGHRTESASFNSLDGFVVSNRVRIDPDESRLVEALGVMASEEFRHCLRGSMLETMREEVGDTPGVEVSEVTAVQPLVVAPAGDQVAAFRVRLVVVSNDRPMTTWIDTVQVRVGRASVTTQATSRKRVMDADRLEQYVAAGVERLQEGMAGETR